ncbi:MAG: mechanosensitive ion channel family protein [Chloroflexi bacterium]|nr:MAG: mechanosensitive ion channel family protein [Chloroflexota bacterium]
MEQLDIEAILQAIETLFESIPLRLLIAAVLVLLIFLLRRLLARLFIQPIRRFVRKHNTQIADMAIEKLLLPSNLLVLALALYIGQWVLQPDPATTLFFQRLTSSLVIGALIMAVYRLVMLFVFSSTRLFQLTGLSVDERLLPLIRTALNIIIITLATIIILQEWGIDVSGLIASLGIAGLAISLAAQETLSNLFGFSTIVGDRPFVIGEYIITPDVEGIVEHVGIRSTRIRQPNRAIVTVPNAMLASAAVQRFTRRRIDFKLGVTYKTTADEMTALLERLRTLLTERPNVLADTVAVYFSGFGDSSLDISVFCDVRLRNWRDFMNEREEIYLEVMRIVAEMGLSIAFPSTSVYIESMPASTTE